MQLRLDDIWLLALLHLLPDLLAQDPYNANTRFQSSHGIDSVMKNIQQKSYRVVNSMFVLDLGRDQKLFDDPVFHCCVIGKSDAELATASRVYFRLLHLHPISISITFTSSGDFKLSEALLGSRDDLSTLAFRGVVDAISNMVTNVDEAPFRLDALYVPHLIETWDKFYSTIVEDFTWKSLTQVYKIFFSLEFFGNPVGLITNLGSGVLSFFYEPAMGLMKSPKDFAKGMQKGTANLLKSSVEGLAHTAGKLTETLGRGVKMMSLNDEYIKKQRASSNSSAPKNVGEAVGRGLKDLAGGIYGGTDRCCVRSVPNVQEGGFEGCCNGTSARTCWAWSQTSSRCARYVNTYISRHQKFCKYVRQTKAIHAIPSTTLFFTGDPRAIFKT